MNDLISRQASIDALLGITAIRNTIPLDSAIFNIKKLPSAQPERKTGRWIDITTDESIDVEYKCSECGFEMFSWCGLTNFCPNCGADMRSTE